MLADPFGALKSNLRFQLFLSTVCAISGLWLECVDALLVWAFAGDLYDKYLNCSCQLKDRAEKSCESLLARSAL